MIQNIKGGNTSGHNGGSAQLADGDALAILAGNGHSMRRHIVADGGNDHSGALVHILIRREHGNDKGHGQPSRHAQHAQQHQKAQNAPSAVAARLAAEGSVFKAHGVFVFILIGKGGKIRAGIVVAVIDRFAFVRVLDVDDTAGVAVAVHLVLRLGG